jgi:hypothetical protein
MSTQATQQSKRNKNQKNKNKANQDINKDAPPQSISKLINSIIQLERGNVKVELDDEFVERFGQDYLTTVSLVQQNRNHIDVNGDPVNHEPLTYGIMTGLSLSAARKLFLATPDSQRGTVLQFNTLSQLDIEIPKTYVQILDMIGKTKADESKDWNIRLKYNELMIKRFLTKGLRYAACDDRFLANYIPNNAGQHNLLGNLLNSNISRIVYSDNASAEFVRDNVKSRLTALLTRNIVINVFDNTGAGLAINIGVPQIDPNTATRNQILAWLALLNVNHHTDPNDGNFFTDLLCCGLALLINKFWLINMNTLLTAVDPAFVNIAPLAGLTVQNLLNAADFFHIQEFVANDDFKNFYEAAFTFYSTTVTPSLKSIVSMVNQGNASFGTIGQLVYVNRDEFTNVNYPANVFGIDRSDLNSGTRMAYSLLKVDLVDAVVKSAMCGLVKDVEVGTDYEVTFTQSLKGIRNNFSSKDNILLSNQRTF